MAAKESFFRSVFLYKPQSFYPPYPLDDHPVRKINPSGDSQQFYKDPVCHAFCLHAITRIHDVLYSREVVHKIFSIIQKPLPLNMNEIFNNYYAFFLKGSNVLPLLKMKYNYTRYPLVQFPVFSSDFDCSLLINPDLEDFKIIREILLVEVAYVMKDILNDPHYWALIRRAYAESGLKTYYYDINTIDVRDEALSSDDFDLSTHVYNGVELKTKTMLGCPFQYTIHPNLSYKNASLGFALLKLQTRTEPPIDLLDISVPSRMYADLKMDWNIHGGIHIAFGNTIRLYISDFLSTYVDFRLAAKKDTRKNKSKKRSMMANTLRNNILKPMLQLGLMNREEIDRMKKYVDIQKLLSIN